ncbi:MAG: hypothetical protein L3J84_05535 [Gammaproteobacteria bacterium]|nr:hypothetical protein [Gammaproteobacteria bacterium]
MVKIHIWMPDGSHVGHTAMSVRNEYFSFWPDGEAGAKDLKIKRSQPGMLMDSLQDDVRNEGNRPPATIEIENLDEDGIIAFITDVQDDMPRYQLARNNCSHMIANILIKGGNCKPSFTPHAGHYGIAGRVLGVGIWTPDQILKFAQELSRS